MGRAALKAHEMGSIEQLDDNGDILVRFSTRKERQWIAAKDRTWLRAQPLASLGKSVPPPKPRPSGEVAGELADAAAAPAQKGRGRAGDRQAAAAPPACSSPLWMALAISTSRPTANSSSTNPHTEPAAR